MAQINLGSIKFNWQGAYNGATAYSVDDVVSYNGSSYICKLASTGNLPTNTTYFDQMSQKGTDADLLSIASTAQGDIYYNNGSAIARLGAGTSGQFLKTQGTGANPIWSDAGGGLVQTNTNYKTDTYSTTTINSWVQITGVDISLSSVGSNSHRAIGNFGFSWGTYTSDTINSFRITKTIDGGSTYTVLANHVHGSATGGASVFQGQTQGLRSMLDNNGGNYTNLPFYDDAIGTTGTVTYQLEMYRTQAGTFYLNRNYNDANIYGRGSTNMWVMEVKV